MAIVYRANGGCAEFNFPLLFVPEIISGPVKATALSLDDGRFIFKHADASHQMKELKKFINIAIGRIATTSDTIQMYKIAGSREQAVDR